MSRGGEAMIKSRLWNLRLYKFHVPCESDVGVFLVSYGGRYHQGMRFRLTQFTGQGQGRGTKAGLSKSFIDDLFFHPKDANISRQIFDYIVSNFSFKDLEIVPPACPVLVFHFHIRDFGSLVDDHVPPQVNIPSIVLTVLETRDSVLRAEDAITRLVPIVPPTTEIVQEDCYSEEDSCCTLCQKGYNNHKDDDDDDDDDDDEIVHKTICNHIFHATCISRYLSRTPQCPVCSAHLPPLDIRTLLFS